MSEDKKDNNNDNKGEGEAPRELNRRAADRAFDRGGEEIDRESFRPKNFFESLSCAFEGVLYAFKTQNHVRVHYGVAIFVVVLSQLLDLDYIEFMLFVLSILILLAAEMLNTAIEDLSNLVERRYNERIKRVKDVSAGGVLISSLGVVIMGYMVISKYLTEPFSFAIGKVKTDYGMIVAVTLLLVMIAVVFVKSLSGGEKGLSKSLPSGHSALAFSMWTAVTFLTSNALVSVLTFLMALMVCHSRLLMGKHTITNFFTGALSGIGLTVLIFYLFGAILS